MLIDCKITLGNRCRPAAATCAFVAAAFKQLGHLLLVELPHETMPEMNPLAVGEGRG